MYKLAIEGDCFNLNRIIGNLISDIKYPYLEKQYLYTFILEIYLKKMRLDRLAFQSWYLVKDWL